LTLNSRAFQNMTLNMRIVLKWGISPSFLDFANFFIVFLLHGT